MQNLAVLSAAAAGVGSVAYYKTSSTPVQFELVSALGPTLRLLDAETTHNLGIWAARLGMFPKETRPDDPVLRTRVWNRDFKNPIGAERAGQRRKCSVFHSPGWHRSGRIEPSRTPTQSGQAFLVPTTWTGARGSVP